MMLFISSVSRCHNFKLWSIPQETIFVPLKLKSCEPWNSIHHHGIVSKSSLSLKRTLFIFWNIRGHVLSVSKRSIKYSSHSVQKMYTFFKVTSQFSRMFLMILLTGIHVLMFRKNLQYFQTPLHYDLDILQIAYWCALTKVFNANLNTISHFKQLG